MNKTIASMLLIAVAGLASAATGDEAQKKAPAAAQIASLPKDAVGNPDGTYLWVDKQNNKSWIYRKSGAGYTRTVAPPIPVHNLQIPKNAVANADGSYDWTDKDGKKWKFANTPFGLVKNPIDAPATQAAPVDARTKVIDKGDTVRFERSSPFGVSGYDKKKSELNDDERRLYEASKSKPE